MSERFLYKFGVVDKYEDPPGYKYPEKYEDQRDSLEHANVNVDEFREKPQEITDPKLLPFFQCMDRNSEGTVVIGTNNYHARTSSASIFGFEKLDENKPKLLMEQVAFKTSTESAVCSLKFVNDTMFLCAENCGVTLYSTESAMRESENSSKFSLFKIGIKNYHDSILMCMDIFRSTRQKAVTCDGEGGIVTWDVASSDLVSIDVLRSAHIDAINDVATSDNNEFSFVTASNDKNLFSWDMRDARPCSALIENHPFQIQAVSYVNESQLLVGDRTGFVYLIDAKMPNKIVTKNEVHDRSIHKFIVNG